MSDALINLRDVTFGYAQDWPVLRDLHFRLDAGERVGLIGANGSGKSTLLHLIVGLLRPEKGAVEVLGMVRRREEDFHEVRRRVGLLFQDADDQLFCPTVAEDVAFGPLNLGKSPREARAKAHETLEQLDLTSLEDRVTYKLSGGEKRLAALAGVLVMQPRILLLDEPIAGLDPNAEARVTELLAELPQEMVVVSHDAAFLSRLTSRRVRLANGRAEAA